MTELTGNKAERIIVDDPLAKYPLYPASDDLEIQARRDVLEVEDNCTDDARAVCQRYAEWKEKADYHFFPYANVPFPVGEHVKCFGELRRQRKAATSPQAT